MKRMIWIALGLFMHGAVHGQGGAKLTREAYIQTYSELAMKEMARVGIPASIKLAQGCLESNNGNSTLAVKANNHFGIKCHDWTGKTINHDDDHRNECFRAYASAYESYRDHSQFLTTKPRYAALFELQPHDYRAWAKGLKKAGYATATSYSSLLIKIIEENELYKYDLMVLEGGVGAGTDTTSHLTEHRYPTSRDIRMNNRIEFIIVKPGDTPESLRNELGLYKNELYNYNDLYRGTRLEPGQIIYLQPKRRKAAMGNEIHVVEEGQTMNEISQIYGVRLKSLYKRNLMVEGEQPVEGIEIYLRRKKREPLLKLEPIEESHDEDEMQFRFESP